MRIYISGPITGVVGYKERFEYAEKMLLNKGHFPVSPCKVDAIMPPDATWKDFMTVDTALLSVCDAIYMLYGWEKSKGAKQEIIHAIMTEMPIYLSAFDVPIVTEGEENAGKNEIQS